MLRRLVICTLCSLMMAMNGLWSQTPFECKGQYYLSLSPSLLESSNLYEVNIDPNSNLAVFDPVRLNIGNNLNGMGYRSTDNLIYGVDPARFFLYQVDANGDSKELKKLDLTFDNEYYAGDVTPDGKQLIIVGGNKNNGFDNEIIKIELSSNDYSLEKISFFENTRIFDIAFNPIDGKLYAVDSRNKRLIIIDPDTGQITQSFPQQPSIRAIGALFFDTFGNLFGYGSVENSQQQNKLFKINKNNGDITVLTTGPITEGNDGCSCPYTIKLEKTVSPEETFPCEEVEYTFTIANSSGITRSGIDLQDVLPNGLQYVDIVRNPYGGDASMSSGSFVSIENMDIPPGKDSIIIKVYVDDIPAGIYSNQAVLLDLPESLGTFTLSDNPKTFIKEDSTDLRVLGLSLDFIEEYYGKCEGQDLVLDANIPGATIEWEDGSNDPLKTITGPGTYTLTAKNNCQTISKTILVEEEYIDVDVDTYLFEVELGDFINQDAQVRTNAMNFTLDWDNSHPQNTYDCNNCVSTSIQPLFTSTTTLYATTPAGCQDSVDIKIRVKKVREVLAPNVFSPNGDGNNDLFFLQGLDNVMVNRFEIFDRWGNIMFSASGNVLGESSMAWRGSYGDQIVNPGVYVWYAEVEWLDGHIEYLAGDVTVLR